MDTDDEQDPVEASARPAARPTSVSRVKSRGWPQDELENCLKMAEEGHPASARRVAELLELQRQHAEAAAWWHRAVALGDEDAALYVKEIYGT